MRIFIRTYLVVNEALPIQRANALRNKLSKSTIPLVAKDISSMFKLQLDGVNGGIISHLRLI